MPNNDAAILEVITDGGFLPRHGIGAWAVISGRFSNYGTMPCNISTYAELFAYYKAIELARIGGYSHLIITNDCEGSISVMARKVFTRSNALNKLIVKIRAISVGIQVGYRCVARKEVSAADRACEKAFKEAGYHC